MSGDCLERFTPGRGMTVLAELRRAGVDLPDRWTEVPAGPVDPETYVPLRTTVDFAVAGRPALWFTPDRSAALVDERLFSPLTVVDVPRLAAGERMGVGRLAPDVAATADPREVLRFLLHADVVQTYWHMGADLCLEQEERGADGYRAILDGVHHYYTNTANHDPVRFTLTITPDGLVEVCGA